MASNEPGPSIGHVVKKEVGIRPSPVLPGWGRLLVSRWCRIGVTQTLSPKTTKPRFRNQVISHRTPNAILKRSVRSLTHVGGAPLTEPVHQASQTGVFGVAAAWCVWTLGRVHCEWRIIAWRHREPTTLAKSFWGESTS